MQALYSPGRILREALTALEDAVASLVKRLGPPLLINDDRPRVRYLNPTSHHVQILKAVRVVSGLHATVVLLQTGSTQEAGAILRTLYDFLGEINFLDEAHSTGPNEAQKRFVQDFFSEAVDPDSEGATSSRKVDRKVRQKVRASEARVLKAFSEPASTASKDKKIMDFLHGYVHGRYPHIMHTYMVQEHGVGEGFVMHGLTPTPHIERLGNFLISTTHWALNTIAKLLLDVGDVEGSARVSALRDPLEAEYVAE